MNVTYYCTLNQELLISEINSCILVRIKNP